VNDVMRELNINSVQKRLVGLPQKGMENEGRLKDKGCSFAAGGLFFHDIFLVVVRRRWRWAWWAGGGEKKRGLPRRRESTVDIFLVVGAVGVGVVGGWAG